jgi:MoaA/NifB/PqqE/SkfB family radical SAM enzyme
VIGATIFRLFSSRFGRPFDWLQVEVTTACTGACVYCPRTVFRPRWPNRFLSPETFDRLQSVLPLTRHVHLQGWGEPLLHPEFFRFARAAKAAGCRVGTTTNGMGVNEDRLQQFIDLEVDVLAFSLAGADAGQDEVRRGTRFATVLSAMETLNRLKARRGAVKPAVHVAYLLLRSKLADLPRLPSVLAGLGVAQVVISTLDYVATPELMTEVVRPRTAPEFGDLEARLEAVSLAGAQAGITFHHSLRAPGEGKRRCPENPERALVVAADGGVSPCVFTSLPETGDPGGPGGMRSCRHLTFGNLNEAELLDIWNRPAYRDFRSAFGRKLPPPSCRGCPKLY